VDLKNKPKDLSELNPYAKVPVLVDGDGVVYESAIVNEYLEEKYPQTRLMPAEQPEKAQERMQKHLQALEQEMAGKRYIVGDYSLADVTFIPFYVRRQRYGATIDDRFPNLKRWGEDLVARPAVVSTL
jgi:glutathione S-transferase